MIIDCHHHWMPKGYVDKLSSGQYLRAGEHFEMHKGVKYHIRDKDHFPLMTGPNDQWADLEPQIATMDELGIDKAILSLCVPDDWFDVDDYRQCNNEAAEIQERYKGRFFSLATVRPTEKSGIYELERCVKELGLKGVGLLTHIQDVPLDSDRLWPFYQKVVELGVPIFFHAANLPAGGHVEWYNAYSLGISLTRLHSMEIATLRLLYSGLHERFPELQFISPHLGGGFVFKIPWYIDNATRRNPWLMPGENGAPVPSDHYPIEDFKRNLGKFYFEIGSCAWGDTALKCATEILSPERILFGTDSPLFPGNWTKMTVQLATSLDIPDERKRLFLSGNAARLFKI